ncbi:hypothetical protein BRARA_B00666 [Brassica rapa]|uniref:Uncharacterized protein n=1 Tax=Brassica campestris TaxID=3711 RepID=A0A398A7V0_BRACM|nr:hypothetical protein BRARA_B00666 [Brassica rapa]
MQRPKLEIDWWRTSSLKVSSIVPMTLLTVSSIQQTFA